MGSRGREREEREVEFFSFRLSTSRPGPRNPKKKKKKRKRKNSKVRNFKTSKLAISSLAPSRSLAFSIDARYEAASGATFEERSAAAAAADFTTSLPASAAGEPSETSAADLGTPPPSFDAVNDSARWQKFPRFASSSALVLAARSDHLKSVSEDSGREERR